MRTMICLLGMLVAALAAFPAIASADDVEECPGGFIFGTVDNVVVPPNTECVVFRATVLGNVKALANAGVHVAESEVAGSIQGERGSRVAANVSQVGGNVEAHRPARVEVRGSTVGGNIHAIGATGPGLPFGPLSLSVVVCDTTMPNGDITVEKTVGGTVAVGSEFQFCPGNRVQKGNILVQENLITPNEAMSVVRNVVGGNVQVFKNRGSGLKFVFENTVAENLQCRQNDPPFAGGPNAARQAEGQCFLGP